MVRFITLLFCLIGLILKAETVTLTSLSGVSVDVTIVEYDEAGEIIRFRFNGEIYERPAAFFNYHSRVIVHTFHMRQSNRSYIRPKPYPMRFPAVSVENELSLINALIVNNGIEGLQPEAPNLNNSFLSKGFNESLSQEEDIFIENWERRNLDEKLEFLVMINLYLDVYSLESIDFTFRNYNNNLIRTYLHVFSNCRSKRRQAVDLVLSKIYLDPNANRNKQRLMDRLPRWYGEVDWSEYLKNPMLARNDRTSEEVLVALFAEASPLQIDRKGNTLLHYAALYGNATLLKLLIDYLQENLSMNDFIESLNRHNNDNFTPLMLATDREVIRILMLSGARSLTNNQAFGNLRLLLRIPSTDAMIQYLIHACRDDVASQLAEQDSNGKTLFDHSFSRALSSPNSFNKYKILVFLHNTLQIPTNSSRPFPYVTPEFLLN